MADNILGNIVDDLKDQAKEKLDPKKALTEGNLKKKRGAFWTCFIAALLLVVLAAGAALYWNATKVSLFQQGLDSTVVAQGVVSQADATAFANETLDYLTGVRSQWEPAVTIADHRVGVPEAFKTHMATVKGWVSAFTGVIIAGLGIVAVLLLRALIGRKGGRKSPFSLGGWYLGAAIPLLLLGGVGAWALLDFDGLWNWLHATFIPDGIFAATDEIMKLFPVELFAGYLRPVALTFAVLAAAVLALPLLLRPLSVLLTNLFGKRETTTRRRTTTRKRSTSRSRSAARRRTK